MILSRSEEETLEEQILNCCVREEREEAEVTLTIRPMAEGKGRSKEEEGLRGFGVVSKRKVLPFLSRTLLPLLVHREQDWSLLLSLLSASPRNPRCGFYLSAVRCLCLNILASFSTTWKNGKEHSKKCTERIKYSFLHVHYTLIKISIITLTK